MLNPRLVALSGPLQGTVRALTDGPLSMGRDTANRNNRAAYITRSTCYENLHIVSFGSRPMTHGRVGFEACSPRRPLQFTTSRKPSTPAPRQQGQQETQNCRTHHDLD